MLLVTTEGEPLIVHVLVSMDNPVGREGETLQVALVKFVMPDVLLHVPVPVCSYHATVSSPFEAETMSRSPSTSMSATNTDFASVAFVAMSTATHVGSAAPSFSYHAIVWSFSAADTISRSPSPSMSAANTDFAPSAVVAMVAAAQEGSAAPSFSYHAIVSSTFSAEIMSRSPSPSMSATNTDLAPDAEVLMSAAVQEGSAAPSFSYHAIVLSP